MTEGDIRGLATVVSVEPGRGRGIMVSSLVPYLEVTVGGVEGRGRLMVAWLGSSPPTVGGEDKGRMRMSEFAIALGLVEGKVEGRWWDVDGKGGYEGGGSRAPTREEAMRRRRRVGGGGEKVTDA